MPGVAKSIETERIDRKWLPGTGGEAGNGELSFSRLFNGYRVSGGKDEKVLEMDIGDGCTAM